MKKFAAIAAASLLLLSVFIVSASAREVDPLERAGIPVLRSPVRTSSASSPLSSSYYTYELVFSDLPETSASAWDVYAVYVYDGSDQFVIGSSGSLSSFMRAASGTYGYTYDNSFVSIGSSDWSVVHNYPVVILSPSSSLVTSGNVTVSGTLASASPVSDLAGSIFTVGSSLLSFITANWITLLAITSFLVILCFGTIRRLVKGV